MLAGTLNQRCDSQDRFTRTLRQRLATSAEPALAFDPACRQGDEAKRLIPLSHYLRYLPEYLLRAAIWDMVDPAG
jgi:hypothetical protein